MRALRNLYRIRPRLSHDTHAQNALTIESHNGRGVIGCIGDSRHILQAHLIGEEQVANIGLRVHGRVSAH